MPNFMKNCTVVAEFFHEDGRTDTVMTDMTKLIFAFRNFANALVTYRLYAKQKGKQK